VYDSAPPRETRCESSLCAESDAVARYLLTQTAASNLEITANTLEAAFVTLTADAKVAA
jgi:hypothetical protein